jgi:hypothetical protein
MKWWVILIIILAILIFVALIVVPPLIVRGVVKDVIKTGEDSICESCKQLECYPETCDCGDSCR